METAPDLTISGPVSPDLTLAGLIHDLNNVFQTLVEAADLLSDDPRWQPVSAAMFRSIERGRDLTLSLQAANQVAAPFETVLGKTVTFVQDFVGMHAGPRIAFACDVAPGVVVQRPWDWERVLMNLFLNSVQAMPAGGTIAVSVRHKGREVEIVVADDGVGIAPELLPRIFEPGVSTKAGGGLGLHIVSSIVRNEDGTVRAANRETGGAQFTITIPAGLPATRSASA